VLPNATIALQRANAALIEDVKTIKAVWELAKAAVTPLPAPPPRAPQTIPEALKGVITSGQAEPGFAPGGYIRGRGSSTSDSILARLSNGEFVVNARAVGRLGVGFSTGSISTRVAAVLRLSDHGRRCCGHRLFMMYDFDPSRYDFNPENTGRGCNRNNKPPSLVVCQMGAGVMATDFAN
jgi:hypothetical protein